MYGEGWAEAIKRLQVNIFNVCSVTVALSCRIRLRTFNQGTLPNGL